VLDEIAREVDAVNERFSHSERIRRFAVLGAEWLPDSNELTPTMKLKRRSILTEYGDVIASLYP